MARPSSKIMTPGDLRAAKAALKKELALVGSALKATARAAKTDAATYVKKAKDADALLATATKQHAKTLKYVEKTRAANSKAHDRIAAERTKVKAKLEAQLAALESTPTVKNNNVDASVLPVKRGPGRPRKDATQSVEVGASVIPVKRGPGRPRKDATQPTA